MLVSAGEKIFKVSLTGRVICSRCDHMMMDEEMEKWNGKKRRRREGPRSLILARPSPSLHTPIRLSLACASVSLCPSVRGALRGWERERERGKMKKEGDEEGERALVLCPHLIKDHSSRHRLRREVCEIYKGKMLHGGNKWKWFLSSS